LVWNVTKWEALPYGGTGASQVVSGSYAVQSNDSIIFVDTSSTPGALTLPAAPTLGEKHVIKDFLQNAHVNNIVINGNGKQIEQFGGGFASSLTLGVAGDSASLAYNGVSWSIL
jgi:hypothetical protein